MPRTPHLEIPRHFTLDELAVYQGRFAVLLADGRIGAMHGLIDDIERTIAERSKPRSILAAEVQISELSSDPEFIRTVNALERIGVFNCAQLARKWQSELLAVPGFGDKMLAMLLVALRERLPRIKGRIFEAIPAKGNFS